MLKRLLQTTCFRDSKWALDDEWTGVAQEAAFAMEVAMHRVTYSYYQLKCEII